MCVRVCTWIVYWLARAILFFTQQLTSGYSIGTGKGAYLYRKDSQLENVLYGLNVLENLKREKGRAWRGERVSTDN
jgi:hypothetical protein